MFDAEGRAGAAYRSLVSNTSRQRTGYRDFPMPEAFPDFPHHTQMAAYFNAYVDHFGLRDRRPSDTSVTRAERLEDHRWRIELQPISAVRGSRKSKSLNFLYRTCESRHYRG